MAETLTEADFQAAARTCVATAAELRSEVERTGMSLQHTLDLAAKGLLHVVPSNAAEKAYL